MYTSSAKMFMWKIPLYERTLYRNIFSKTKRFEFMNTKNQFGKKGWTQEIMKSQQGKTFVITGTTSGTGFEAARILLSKGAKVVMLNRNPKKSADVINKN